MAAVSGWRLVIVKPRSVVSTMSAASSGPTLNPSAANLIAGLRALASEIVPQCSSAVVTPRSVPGTPTEMPLVEAISKVSVPNMFGVAAAGAISRESM